MAEAADDLSNQFEQFCKVSGKSGKMTNKAWAKMVRDTGVIDKKKFTSTDTDILWSKMCPKGQTDITYKQFMDKLEKEVAPAYAKKKGLSDEDALADLKNKISASKAEVKGTKISKTGNVSGLTDSKGYTGSHKERFDESGKGKGAAGRTDKASTEGYVQGYKEKDSYDKKH